MPPAVIAGGIAAVGTIGGALISSHSQNSAIDSANASQQAATQAQLELGHESLDLQKQLAQQSMGLNQSLYNSNYDLLSPFVSRGKCRREERSTRCSACPTLPTCARHWKPRRAGLRRFPDRNRHRPEARHSRASPERAQPVADHGNAERRHSGQLPGEPQSVLRGQPAHLCLRSRRCRMTAFPETTPPLRARLRNGAEAFSR
jgi:hypothetical protein